MPDRHILTSVAWPYASGPRHVGHAAAYVPSDVFSRYHRMAGDKVLMVLGHRRARHADHWSPPTRGRSTRERPTGTTG
jgi:hypothetical protein